MDPLVVAAWVQYAYTVGLTLVVVWLVVRN